MNVINIDLVEPMCVYCGCLEEPLVQLSDVGDWSEWTFQEETNSLEQFNLRSTAQDDSCLVGVTKLVHSTLKQELRAVRVGWDSCDARVVNSSGTVRFIARMCRTAQMQMLAFQERVWTRPAATLAPVLLVTKRVPVRNTNTTARGRVCGVPVAIDNADHTPSSATMFERTVTYGCPFWSLFVRHT